MELDGGNVTPRDPANLGKWLCISGQRAYIGLSAVGMPGLTRAGIRRESYPDYFAMHGQDWEHIDHCIEVVRQSIVCSADIRYFTHEL